MTSWSILRRVRPWEWIIVAVCVAAIIYALSGCVGASKAIDPLAEHGTQLAIATAIGAGVALLLGVTGWGVVAAPAVGSAVTIFATPGPNGNTQPPSPGVSLMQYVIFGAIAYVLWIRRARIIDGLRSGSFKALAAHWGHAFLGTKRPRAN